MRPKSNIGRVLTKRLPKNLEKMSYEEDVLIKLRRKYSKDEVVSALFKKMSDKDLEIGKLLSEIDFLNSELNWPRHNIR